MRTFIFYILCQKGNKKRSGNSVKCVNVMILKMKSGIRKSVKPLSRDYVSTIRKSKIVAAKAATWKQLTKLWVQMWKNNLPSFSKFNQHFMSHFFVDFLLPKIANTEQKALQNTFVQKGALKRLLKLTHSSSFNKFMKTSFYPNIWCTVCVYRGFGQA